MILVRSVAGVTDRAQRVSLLGAELSLPEQPVKLALLDGSGAQWACAQLIQHWDVQCRRPLGPGWSSGKLSFWTTEIQLQNPHNEMSTHELVL